MHKRDVRMSEHDDGTYVVKKSRKSNILAFILCLLVAFVIWAYTESYGNEGVGQTDTGADTQQSDVA